MTNINYTYRIIRQDILYNILANARVLCWKLDMNDDLPGRLKSARKAAGCKTLDSAAEHLEVNTSTYGHHENGQRTPSIEALLLYARKFSVDPCWLAFGDQTSVKVGEVSEAALKQIITYVLSHDKAHQSDPPIVAELIVDLCRHVGRSGIDGVEKVVDFQMYQRDMTRG